MHDVRLDQEYHVEMRKLAIIFCLLLFLLMQDFLHKTNATDASGNIVLGDIGVHLQQQVSGCSFTQLSISVDGTCCYPTISLMYFFS